MYLPLVVLVASPLAIVWIAMPCRIRVAHRIVADVGVAIQVLRIVNVRDDAVGLNEASNRRVVVARIVIHQSVVVHLLPSKSVVGRQRAARRADAAKGVVGLRTSRRAACCAR